MNLLTHLILSLVFTLAFCVSVFAETITLECPLNHDPEVKHLYKQKKLESGELEFLFRPKHPLDPEQNWEPICSEGEFESRDFFSIHTDFSAENLGICESQLFRKSMFGLKKKLFAHFIIRYNFKNATLETITLRSSDSDKNGQSEYTTCVRLPPHDTNDKNDS